MTGTDTDALLLAAAPEVAARSSGATVIGCGNWLEKSDRIGPRVLQELAADLGDDVELADVGTTLLGLIDRLRAQELVILVDACIGRGAPGTVQVSEPLLEPTPPLSPTLHQIGPLDALAVAREIYPERLPRQLYLVAIETGDLPEEEEAPARRRAVDAVLELLAAWRGARAASGPKARPTPGEMP